MDLKGRNFLTLKDFTKEEIEYLIDLSAKLKEKKKKGEAVDVLRGKNIALIFEKNSTRTRCSFEVAASDLGMGSTFLDPKSSQIGKKESIKDTARVLGRIYDRLMEMCAPVCCTGGNFRRKSAQDKLEWLKQKMKETEGCL